MHHELKIQNDYYQAKTEGLKLFEIRNNDRGFQKGDTVSYTNPEFPFIARKGKWEITYVTSFAQKDNFVVFGEKKITDE